MRPIDTASKPTWKILLLGALALGGCGGDDSVQPRPLEARPFGSDSLLNAEAGRWLVGTWSPAERRSLEIRADGTFVHEEIYQIGQEGGTVPYPTFCHTIVRGDVSVRQADATTIQYFANQRKTIVPELIIDTRTKQVELVSDASNGEPCTGWVESENRALKVYSLEIRRDGDRFVDAWYEEPYTRIR